MVFLHTFWNISLWYGPYLGNNNCEIILVLKDPHQRAIFDTLGVKGLETEGWQVWYIVIFLWSLFRNINILNDLNKYY